MDQQIYDVFWTLAEGNELSRVEATEKLIVLLKEKQGKAKSPCTELDYTIKRLIRGLSSSRKWARLGFSVAFTEVLRQFPIIKAKDVLGKMHDLLQTSKSKSKTEQSDANLGRMMVFHGMIQAGTLIKADSNEYEKAAQAIVEVQKKRSYFGQMCTQALILLMEKLNSSDFARCVWPQIEAQLSCGWVSCTPDTLMLLLAAAQFIQTKVDKNFLSTHWKTKNILNTKNFDALAKIIQDSTCNHPVVHPVCMDLIERLFKKGDGCVLFWKQAIYSKVFQSGAASSKSLVYQLALDSLKFATSTEQVQAVLSRVLLVNLLQTLATSQQGLHRAAKDLLLKLPALVKEHFSVENQVFVITHMMSPIGSVLFIPTPYTKCIQDMISNLNEENMSDVCKLLMENITGKHFPSSTDGLSNEEMTALSLVTQQQWSVGTLSGLVNISNREAHRNQQDKILHFLLLHAFFTVAKGTKTLKKPKQDLDPKVRENISTMFFKAINRLATSDIKNQHHTKGYISFIDCLHSVVDCAQELLAQPGAVRPPELFNDDVSEHWSKMISVVKKIKKKRLAGGDQVTEQLAFELLFLHNGIQLFTDPKSAQDVLEELHSCYAAARQQKTTSPGSQEPAWVDVVTDLLLSLLVQPSHLGRLVVSTVFTMICPHVTTTTMQLLLNVLRSTSEDEDNPLAFEDDEEEDTEDDASEDGEKEVNGKEESEEEEDSEDEDKEGDVDAELKSKLEAALGKAAVTSDQESEEEEMMDDDAMLRLDANLAAAFKGMVKGRPEAKQRESQLLLYKIRCLDLVEILIEHVQSDAIMLELVFPLLELMQQGYSDKNGTELAIRATKAFHLLVRPRKLNSDPSLDMSKLPTMVKELLTHSTKAFGTPLIRETAAACGFVMRIVYRNHPLPNEGVGSQNTEKGTPKRKKEKASKEQKLQKETLTIIDEGIRSFCLRRDSRINHIFFLVLLEKEPHIFWSLSETLLEVIEEKEARLFCKTQACAMLTVLITKEKVGNMAASDWTIFAEKIITNVKRALSKLTKDATKSNFCQELLGVLHKLMVVSSNESLQAIITPELIEEMQSKKQGTKKEMRKVCNKILGIFNARLRTGEKGKKKKERKRKLTAGDTEDTSPAAKVALLDSSESPSGDQQGQGKDKRPSNSTEGAELTKAVKKKKKKKKSTEEMNGLDAEEECMDVSQNDTLEDIKEGAEVEENQTKSMQPNGSFLKKKNNKLGKSSSSDKSPTTKHKKKKKIST